MVDNKDTFLEADRIYTWKFQLNIQILYHFAQNTLHKQPMASTTREVILKQTGIWKNLCHI